MYCQGNWNLSTLLVGKSNGTVTWKKVCEFLKKLNTELLYDLVTPLLGMYPKEMKTFVHTKTCT